MSVEVLVAAMHQKDYSLVEEMNIQTDAIIGNQCDRDSIESIELNGKHIKYLNFNERGVGLNRNNALMRATADYCVLADDDMRFYDGYEIVVEEQFKILPNADFIVFNIDEKGATNRRKNTDIKKINLFNYMNYGAARFCFKRESLSKHAIYFNQNFGGGTPHSSGEDSLFLRSCLRAKLNIYAVPVAIAQLQDSRDSTWFKGYTEKYFFDKGYFLGTAHRKLATLFSIYLIMTHRSVLKDSGMTKKQVFKIMKQGIKSARS